MSTRLVAAVLCLFVSQSGCAMLSPIQDASSSMWRAFKPRGNDVRMAGDEATGEWDFVGIEGRGDRPLDREYDGFDYLLKSPKHREIERNLGVQ